MLRLIQYIIAPWLAATLVFGIAGCDSTGAGSDALQADENWISLFDGQTLDGWTTKIVGYPAGEDPLETFRAKDGVLYISYDKYGGRLDSRFAHLFYKDPFKAYHLSLEYRFVGEETMNDPPKRKPYNSGVLYHSESPQRMKLNQPFPISNEAQLLATIPDGDHVRYTGSACGMGTLVSTGGNEPVECADSVVPERPQGQWAHFELEVRPDGHVTHWIDGIEAASFDELVLDTSDPRFPSQELIDEQNGDRVLRNGYIALQAEGHSVEFRDIKIKLLE